MAHKHTPLLKDQVKEKLQSKLKIGEKKHDYKDDLDTYLQFIFSWTTYNTYVKWCTKFTDYCHKQHRCKTLDQCRQYVDEYIFSHTEYSPSTLMLIKSALAKLFDCSGKEFAATPPRYRGDIKRSRGDAVRDAHFSEEKNKEFVAFCRATGLRRHELTNLRGDDLVYDEKNGAYRVNVRKGKGGKERTALIIGNVDLVVEMMKRAGTGKVFPKLPEADIHSYRRDYAQYFYSIIARPVEKLTREEIYRCKKDKRGIIYDRAAMLKVSQSLGHNRISVIAGHYLD